MLFSPEGHSGKAADFVYATTDSWGHTAPPPWNENVHVDYIIFTKNDMHLEGKRLILKY